MVQLTNSAKTIKLNTGADIPLLGLGTWRSTEQEAYDAVSCALKTGYRHIDSAAIYKNETPVGRAIKDSGIKREDLFITTKLWGTQHRQPEIALNQSLDRLGLTYVDLYLMHWPVPLSRASVGGEPDAELIIPTKEDGSRDLDQDWDFIKTWQLMQKLLDTGKVKAIGVSNFSISNLRTLAKASTTTTTPAANQVECHPLLPQDELLDYCSQNGIVLEAYSPLGSQDSPLFSHPTVKNIAAKYNVNPGQVLINWGIQRNVVVLPKSVKHDRIVSNFKVFQLEREDVEKLNDLVKQQGEQRFVKPDWSPFPIFE